MEYLSSSPIQTQQIAYTIAQKFKNRGGIVSLIGDLGAGKTTFSQGFAKSLGIKEKIISPTFVLIRQHQLPHSSRYLFHLDLYRLDGDIDITTLGLAEMSANPQNIILIEWAEKITNQLPPNTYHIKFERLSQNQRRITTNI